MSGLPARETGLNTGNPNAVTDPQRMRCLAGRGTTTSSSTCSARHAWAFDEAIYLGGQNLRAHRVDHPEETGIDSSAFANIGAWMQRIAARTPAGSVLMS
jgi:hypothetical protein